MMFECIDKIYPSVSIDTVTGSICTFTDNIGGLPLKSCTSLISGYQEGSGTPSPDNVRPLHAFSSADLYFNTINQWDEQWEEGGISNTTGENIPNSTTIRSVNYVTVNPDTAYYFKSSERLGLRFYGVNRNYLDSTVVNNTALRVPANCYYIRFIVLNTTQYGNDISINYPATDTSYHAFSGAVFTFGQSIYQGYIDWKRGVVVGTHLLKDMGSLSWSINDTFTTLCDFRSSSLQGIIKNGTDSVASDINTEIFETVSRNKQIADDIIDSIAVSNTGRLIVYGDINRYPDITTFRSAMNGVYLAYELATPIEIPLGGINLLTQEGQNNIFADCGDTTVEYINIT